MSEIEAPAAPDAEHAARAHLARKLAQVMAAIDRVPKNGWNDHHRYHYALAADVLDAARRELSARHIAFLPAVTGDPASWLTWKAGKQTVLVAPMAYEFVCGETGARLSAAFAGAGADVGDKALYKALTGAFKYMVLGAFLVPTGDDPEGDSRTDRDVEREPEPERDAAPRIPRDRAESIARAARNAGWSEDDFKANLADVAGHHKVARLNVDEAEAIEARIAAATPPAGHGDPAESEDAA